MSLQGKTVVLNPEKSIMFHDNDCSGFKLDLFNSGNPSEIKIPEDFPEEKLEVIKRGLEHKILLLKEDVPLQSANELERIAAIGSYFETVRHLKDHVKQSKDKKLLKALLEYETNHQNRTYIKSFIKTAINKLQSGKAGVKIAESKEKNFQIKNIVEKL